VVRRQAGHLLELADEEGRREHGLPGQVVIVVGAFGVLPQQADDLLHAREMRQRALVRGGLDDMDEQAGAERGQTDGPVGVAGLVVPFEQLGENLFDRAGLGGDVARQRVQPVKHGARLRRCEPQERALSVRTAEQQPVDHGAFRMGGQTMGVGRFVQVEVARHDPVFHAIVQQRQRAAQAQADLEASGVSVGRDRRDDVAVPAEPEHRHLRHARFTQIQRPAFGRVAVRDREIRFLPAVPYQRFHDLLNDNRASSHNKKKGCATGSCGRMQ